MTNEFTSLRAMSRLSLERALHSLVNRWVALGLALLLVGFAVMITSAVATASVAPASGLALNAQSAAAPMTRAPAISASEGAAKGLLCDAAFSGALPILSELAQLKVAADEASANGKGDVARSLYQAFRHTADEARASGVDLRGLGVMIEGMAKKRETRNRDEEERERRTREIEEVKIIDGRRMVFQPIAPGKFMMGEVGQQIETEITQPFEMAATQTTQVVWRKVVLRAKQKFPSKYDALNADPSMFKGELNPVEQVSWDDVQIWLAALNELAAQGDTIVQEVMPGHKPGGIYRLPTEAEWEFVVRARGTAQGTYHFGENEADLGKYGWFNGNSDQTTHPVATKAPLVIDGREFYDLHGNVWEWTQDAWDGRSPLQGGTDPLGTMGPYRVVRGGSWRSNVRILRSGNHGDWRPPDRNYIVGFRLVRSLP